MSAAHVDRANGSHDVRLTKAAARELDALKPAQAAAVRATIARVGLDDGEPVEIPGAPAGTQYLALKPTKRDAPTVIYRPMLPSEDGDWLVTSLVARDQYDTWQNAVVAGAVGGVLVALARAVLRGMKA